VLIKTCEKYTHASYFATGQISISHYEVSWICIFSSNLHTCL